MTVKPLSFNVVDGLGFAAASGETDTARACAPYMSAALGPLLELLHLADGGRLPEPPAGEGWLAKNNATPMIAALKEQRELWLRPHDRRIGFIRALRNGSEGDNRLVSFLMDAQRAARDVARLPGTTPGQLAAAMEELENNIHEHSDASATGLLAFQAAPGIFEFVAADRGIGILASLQRCPLFAAISDHGKALQSALTDGTSRFGTDSQHGHGFRPIFLGLTNLRGFLRFRSGDHALIINGSSPTLAMAQLAQKPAIDGFFASICCKAPPNRKH